MRLISPLCGMFLLLACSAPRVQVAALRADLSTATPPGTTVEAVERYLSSRKIEHSYSERSRKLYAIIRDVRRGLLVSTAVTMIFVFDEDRKLVDYIVEEVHTGP